MRTALATAEFLPSSAVWIYRQMYTPSIDHALVITNKISNSGTFSHRNIIELGAEAYLVRAIRYKLNQYTNYGPPTRFSSKQRSFVKQALVDNKIELLHIHFGTYAVYFKDICVELDIPFVVTFHGFDITSAVDRWSSYAKELTSLFSSAAFAFVISEDMKTRLISLGCPEIKIKVSYLGVPTDNFTPINRSGRDTLTFLHAGRLTEKKGVVDLVKSFATAFKGQKNVRLTIAGSGEEEQSILGAITKNEIAGQVSMLGNLSQSDLKAAYEDADVFVLNSRVDSNGTKEGLPIGILEASSAGLPVISTLHAGIPESIINGETGILVPERNNEDLVDALKKMQDEGLREAFGKDGRLYMEEKFSLKKCNQILFEYYKEAVS